jgi:CheY-like chemotaxis protein
LIRCYEKKHNLHPIPIIVITGYDAEHVAEECELYHIAGVIAKPINFIELQKMFARMEKEE